METLTPQEQAMTPGQRFLHAQVHYLDLVAAQMQLDRNVHHYLRRPKRELTASIPVVMDSGNLELFTGYRVQHILAAGPTKGGIQYSADLDIETLRALAMANTWKNAVVGLHFGGAEGGVSCNPKALSDGELERLTRRYTSEMNIIMGPEKDIPEPDAHTDERIMAWIMDTYSMDIGFSVPGVVTGKPRSIGGSAPYVETQAWGAVYVVREVLKRRQETLQGCRLALRGLSPLALQVARLLQAEGAMVIAAADNGSCVHNDKGINLDDVARQVRDQGALKADTPAARALEIPSDALLLAGDGFTLTREHMPGLKTRGIIEVSPFAVDADLDEPLRKAGVLHIPNILTQAGAVTAQYVEWVQDIQAFFWDDSEVNTKLEYLLNNCLQRVCDTAQKVDGNLRMAAHMIAVARVAEALRLRGIYP